MSKAIDHLLTELNLHPVLVDVGASASFPSIWRGIARHSIYVGFDPDSRDIPEVTGGPFYKAMIIPEAVTSDKEKNEVQFFLTRSPYCSSTLAPDARSLSNYIFAELFEVEREATVKATTLDAVVERLSLSRLDWMKTDSQGTDLRLFKSLSENTRARVLALDIEPGFMDAYLGEDLFIDAQRELSRSGFWLSNLAVNGTTRIRQSTFRQLTTAHPDLKRYVLENSIRRTPGWVEARYLRTLDWLAQRDFDPPDYALLWIFALLDKQFGFALDVAVEYEHRFGQDAILEVMQNEPIAHLRRARHVALIKLFLRRLWH